MKASKYNFIFPFSKDNNKKLLYNSLTNALAILEDDNKYSQFKNFCKSNKNIEDKEFVNDLIKGGYLIRDDFNEIDFIKVRLYKARYGTKRLSLTIAPTLKCNFKCVYCYEEASERSNSLSEENQQKIISMVENNLDYISDFNVTWYGGEPLLQFDIIKELSTKFIEMCNKKGVNYAAGIITNGYMLTREIASELENLNIKSIQITLDGAKEQHDRRRPLVGGGPTFDTIISNIAKSKDKLPCVVQLRINIDKENVDKIDSIIDILKENELQKHVLPYIAMVESHNNTYSDEKCFHSEAFSQLEINYRTKYNNKANRYLSSMYPQQKRNYCGADSENSYVINSDGKLYKCWCDIGAEDYSIGHVGSIDESSKLYTEYMLYDPTNDTDCKECKYLPICMGGCPNRRLRKSINRCINMKYQLDKFIDAISIQIINESKDAEALSNLN